MHYQTLAKLAILLALPVLWMPCGCQRNDRTPQDNTAFSQPTRSDQVSAISYPLFFVTGKLLEGTSIQLDLVAPPANAPEPWTPDQQQIETLQASDLIIANGSGAPFAKWMVRVSLPESRVIQTTDNFSIEEFIMVKDHRVVHQHGPEGEHSHPFMVAETWLDPAMLKKQAEEIAVALIRCYPTLDNQVRENLEQLNQSLDRLTEQVKGIPKGNVITSTPRLKYLTRAAGLQDTHLLWFDLPEQSTWQTTGEKAFIDRAQEAGSSCMLFDTDPPNWLRERLRELGYPVVSLNSFSRGGLPSEGDFLQVMENNLATLQDGLSR
ncbi:MAG: metal ABC transporter substrate-binding protein [Planctomycetota bacterium]|nr:metal ABC transporter substrate-binding protein [Planctomycetota bacterium]